MSTFFKFTLNTSKLLLNSSKRSVKYSTILLGGGLIGTYYKNSQNHNISALSQQSTKKRAPCDDCGHTHLLTKIHDIKTLDAKALLDRLLDKLNCLENKGQVLDFKYVLSLFKEAGITDLEVAKSIFQVMDYNNSGKLEPENLAGIFSIVHEGEDMEKFEFLFHCLDLNGNSKISKKEMRRVLKSLYEVGYNLGGFHDDEFGSHAFDDMNDQDYASMAKFKANLLTQRIFSYADLNRDGVLDRTEFMRWAQRHGRDSKILANLLRKSMGEKEEKMLGDVEFRMVSQKI